MRRVNLVCGVGAGLALALWVFGGSVLWLVMAIAWALAPALIEAARG